MRDILVCIDDSSGSERALSQAIALADAERARLTILAVIPRPPCWATTPMTAADIGPLTVELATEAKARLCDAVRRVPESLPVTSVLSHASARRALVKETRRGDHDVVVLGGCGRGPLGRWRDWLRCRALRRCEVSVLMAGGPLPERAVLSPAPGTTPAVI